MATSPTLTAKTGSEIPSAGYPLIPTPWTPRTLRGITGWACRWLDLLILQSLFLGTVFLNFLRQTELRFSEFFQLRISLRNLLVALACIALWRAILRSAGLYDLQRIKSMQGYLLRCGVAITGCSLLVGVIERLLKPSNHASQTAVAFWSATVLAMTASRALLLSFDRTIRPRLRQKRNLLIVGTGSRAADVYEEMRGNRDVEYTLVGYLDSDPQAGHVAPDQIIGRTEQLESILMHQEIDEVVIALPMKSQYQTIGDTIAVCEQLGVQSQYFTHHFGTKVTKQRRSAGAKAGRMVLEAVHQDSRLYLKRFVDFFGALFGILALAPLLIATALAVKLTSPGPIIFRQQRFGFGKRKFSMLKFRSMVIDAEARQKELEHLNELGGPAFKIANDPRVTPIGNFIRKMSIDELPQLFNVLLGDMSLVGPRPMPLRDVGRFSEAWLMRRFSVKPGLTCLWQASGRSNLDFDRWIELDLEYIDNWSLALDFEILAKTVPAVLKGRGAS